MKYSVATHCIGSSKSLVRKLPGRADTHHLDDTALVTAKVELNSLVLRLVLHLCSQNSAEMYVRCVSWKGNSTVPVRNGV